MCILQIDFDKHSPEEMQFIADQMRKVFNEDQVLVIPMDVNFIHDLTIDQLKLMKKVVEKELEEREK